MFRKLSPLLLRFDSIQFNYRTMLFTTQKWVHNRALTDEDLLDIFHSKSAPTYEKDIDTLLDNPFETKTNIQNQIKTPKIEVKPVIQCKRSEFNHYKNQKYNKFSPIPLASKGWHHYKSKGDYFTINISDEDEYAYNLFWEKEMSFEDLKLSQIVIDALKRIDITRPTKIQVDGIPILLTGNNCLLTAETGCGKTLAYLLPAIQQVLHWRKALNNRPPNTPLVLILTPGRELAQQIYTVAKSLTDHLPVTCNVLIGGRTKQKMLNPHFQHTDILIATIGAMSKLTTTGIYKVSEVKHLILDEADTMLDDSFNELLLRYLKKFKIHYQPEGQSDIPKNTQLTLISATLPTSLNDILQDYVDTNSFSKISTSRIHKLLPHVPQTFLRLGPSEKPAKLLHLVKDATKKKKPTIIFSNRSRTCDWISMMLNENGVKVAQLNGDMPQILRKGKFQEFQNGLINVLSCTDIASRGLDTIRAQHVINYDFPLYMADYIHRCGRTGRIGSSTKSLVTNLVCGDREVELVNKIELAVRMMDVLPNVNANITKIIHHKIQKSLNIQN